MSTTPDNLPSAPNNAMLATRSKPSPKTDPKTYTDAFWEALVRRGVTPERAAAHVPDLFEFEIAAQMTKARGRLAAAAAQKQDETINAARGACDRSRWGYRVGSAKGIRR